MFAYVTAYAMFTALATLVGVWNSRLPWSLVWLRLPEEQQVVMLKIFDPQRASSILLGGVAIDSEGCPTGVTFYDCTLIYELLRPGHSAASNLIASKRLVGSTDADDMSAWLFKYQDYLASNIDGWDASIPENYKTALKQEVKIDRIAKGVEKFTLPGVLFLLTAVVYLAIPKKTSYSVLWHLLAYHQTFWLVVTSIAMLLVPIETATLKYSASKTPAAVLAALFFLITLANIITGFWLLRRTHEASVWRLLCASGLALTVYAIVLVSGGFAISRAW